MKKQIGLVTICLLIVIGAIWSFYKNPSESPVYSTVSLSDKLKENQSFSIGNFQLNWVAETTHFEITEQENKDHIIFSSPLNNGFLAVGYGVMESEATRGHFTIKENRQYVCDKQSIDQMHSTDDQIVIEGILECPGKESVPYQFLLTSITESQLQYEVILKNKDVNRTYLSWFIEEDEHFFGFGEQYSAFDMKGKRLPILVQEQGIGRGAQPITFLAELTNGAGGSWSHTYAPVPQFISSKIQSLYSENKEYQIFHFTDNYKAQLEVFSNHIKGKIYVGKTPASLVEEHTSVVGRMKALPDWTQNGLMLGVQGGTKVAGKKLDALLEHDVPITGLWIQDWVGQRKTDFGKQLWWNWELDEDHYANWDTFKQALDEKDIKVLGYVNPFVVDTSEKENVKMSLYNVAKEKDFLIKDENGDPLSFQITSFDAGLIDLTIPEARVWLKDVLKTELIDRGFSGWMADFGEALPHDVILASGESGLTYHNRYPEEWAKLNREVLEETGMLEEAMFFSRAGFSESPKYTSSFWLGDQLVTWDEHDGIKTAVTGLLSSGLSGFSLNHSDIGGYTTITNFPLSYIRKKELMLRWIELNAFTSLFRSHEGNRPEDNVQLVDDEEIIAHVKKFGEIFKTLAPYRKNLMEEAEKTGAPVVRSLFFNYPNDKQTYDIQYEQFMLGNDLLIAPVLDKGKEKVNVYLPEGDWTHLWTGEAYSVDEKGIYVEVEAPLGEPGVFYRNGSEAGELLLKVNLPN